MAQASTTVAMKLTISTAPKMGRLKARKITSTQVTTIMATRAVPPMRFTRSINFTMIACQACKTSPPL